MLGEAFGHTAAYLFEAMGCRSQLLSFSLFASPPVSMSAHVSFLSFFGLAALLESLLVVRELGVQVTTKYVDGREKSTVRGVRPSH